MRWLQKVFLVGLHRILLDHPVEVTSSFVIFLFFSTTQLRKIVALRKRRPLVLLGSSLLLLTPSEHPHGHLQGLRLANLLHRVWLLLSGGRDKDGRVIQKAVQAGGDV